MDSQTSPEGQQVIAGRQSVLELLKSGRPVHRLYVAAGRRQGSILPIIALAREAGVPVQEVPEARLTSLAQAANHQGVVATAAAHGYVEVEDLLEAAAQAGEVPLLLALDGVEDPGNLGAIIRTAGAAGAHGVIIPKRRAAGLTAAAAKAAAGALEHVRVAQVTNLTRTLIELKEQGLWVVGADAGAEDSLYMSDLTGPLVLVVGGEDRGLSRLVAETCDRTVRIPMRGPVSSLNASVAAALCLFEVRRQRDSRQS